MWVTWVCVCVYNVYIYYSLYINIGGGGGGEEESNDNIRIIIIVGGVGGVIVGDGVHIGTTAIDIATIIIAIERDLIRWLRIATE